MQQRALLILLTSLAMAATSPQLAVQGLDPVALTTGSEVAGRSEFEIIRKGFLYRFASAQSRSQFETRPDLYEIQMDGACARMGPASGAGDPARYLIHDSRIYVFASDACRNSFAKDPAAHLDPVVTPPAVPGEMRRQGEALLARMLVGAGGAAAIDALRSYQEEATADTAKPADKPQQLAWRYLAPGSFRRETVFPGWGTAVEVITPQSAFEQYPSSSALMREGQRDAVRKSLLHRPLAAFRSRTGSTFQVWAEGAVTAGVYFDGVLFRLSLDPATGRTVRMEYRGRGPGSTITGIERVYSDFRETGGLWLPYRTVSSAGGKPWPAASYTTTTIRINAELPESLFLLPATAGR